MYCRKCGGKVDSYASHCPFCGEPVKGNSVEATYKAEGGSDVSHKSIGSWIVTYIITAIPLLNIIMLFIWAFGGKTKSNLTFRNWARAILIMELICYILIIAGAVVLALFFPEAAQKMSDYLEEYNMGR